MYNEKLRIVPVLKEGNAQYSCIHQIFVDRNTGVQYLFVQSEYGAGLTPLIDQDGKPLLAELIED